MRTRTENLESLRRQLDKHRDRAAYFNRSMKHAATRYHFHQGEVERLERILKKLEEDACALLK